MERCVLLAAANYPRKDMHTASIVFAFRYPTSSAEDDIRVLLVLMMIMNMWGATLRVTITDGVILDAHNVSSHLAVFLTVFQDTQR